MTSTKTMTEEEMFADQENATEDNFPQEIPDFEKMKLVELKAFATAELPVQAEELCKLKKADLIIALKNAFPNPDALDSPQVTGFNPMDPIHATVSEVQGLKSEEEAIKYIRGLVDANDFNFFQMGGMLAEMLTHGWMGEYDDFGSMVEGEFGLKYRKALYLIVIYHAVVSCGASWDEVKKIGWSKLRLIATLLTPDNYKAWFEKIADVSFVTVEEMVKAAGADGSQASADAGAESTPKKTLKFVVHEDQLETIKEALKKARAAGNTEFDGPALEWICIDYLAGGATQALSEAAQGTTVANGEAESEEAFAPQEAFTRMIEKLIETEDEPFDALVIALDAFEAAFKIVYPDVEFDVYTDGKPDEDELAADES